MSTADRKPAAARFAIPRVPLRWVAILGVAVVLLVGGLVAAMRSGHSGSGNGTLTGSPSTGGVSDAGNTGGGQDGHGGNGAANGGPGGAAGSSPNPAGAGSGASAGGQHPAKATGTPYAMPSPGDNVAAVADLQTSNCSAGYPPGYVCKTYVHGRYFLYSHPAGQLIVEVVVDGQVNYSQTYQAPGGPHAFGSLMQFSVPKGAHEVDFVAILEDLTGNTLAKSKPIVTYNS